MKKRLLITSALMTAVLGASLATGTYAWYQASASGAAISATASGQLAVADPTIELDGINLTANLNAVASSTMQLAEWDSTNSEWDHYYLDADKNEVAYEGENGLVNSKAYAVVVSLPNTNPSEEIATLLGRTITISVSSTDARVYKWASAHNAPLTDNCNYSSTTSVEFTFPDTQAAFYQEGVLKTFTVAYVAVAYNGNNVEDEANVVDEEITAPFTVSIANQ